MSTRLSRFVLICLALCSLFASTPLAPGSSLPRPLSKLSLEEMETALPGAFPKHRYVVHDPSVKCDVIKIAYVRETTPYSTQNPLIRGFNAFLLLPIPVWDNAEFTYGKNATKNAASTDSYYPDDVIRNRFLTVIVDNPPDLNDYDVVIRENVVDGAKRRDYRFKFSLLFHYGHTRFPDLYFQVNSDIGVRLEKTYRGLQSKRIFLTILPIWWRDDPRKVAPDFHRLLYTQMLQKIQDPSRVIRDRKRKYVFSQSPRLKEMEDYLKANVKTLEPAAARALLRCYKEQFDYLEWRRCLAELRDLGALRALLDKEIATAQQLASQQGQGAKKESQAVASNLTRLKEAVFVPRANPGVSPIDITFGRNYDLYDEELSLLMQTSGPLEVRQYPISELLSIAEQLKPVAEGFPGFEAAFSQVFTEVLRKGFAGLPPEYRRFSP